ncbi:unnamed protein product [Adineta ricciae]|uniref:NAD(P)(+)--arginine ADP-ribosyltransferase n=2 Tax=Adineta ricciae TaxID=249248 RepID=A0A815RQH8_ADIRI|nr:unnamed protein product [Adineta ricciae]
MSLTRDVKSIDDNSNRSFTLERHKHAELHVQDQVPPIRTNYEQVTLVWLDSHARNNGPFADDIHLTEELLRKLNDYVMLFDNELECLTYVDSVKNETVLLIVSGRCATSNLLDALQKLSYVDSIFIFCQNKNNYERLKEKYKKVVGIFTEQRNLGESIRNAIELIDRQSTIFALYNVDKQKSMRDLSRESGSFIFLQLIKQVIKRMAMNNGSADDSKQEMVDKCRLYYRGNEKELENIKEFDKHYTPNQAIKWYTRDSFVYKLINKALRTEDIDSLYTYRFYIVDICECLTENCQILRDVASDVTVYRGMKMRRAEIERLQESIGHHIAVNGFFSTSRDRSVAEMYAGINAAQPVSSVAEDTESVVFVIYADLEVHPDLILADVCCLSSFRDEGEVLFDLGTVFKILSFTYDIDKNYRICHMEASDEGRTIAQGYLDFKQKELHSSSDIEIVFGDLLHVMGEWLKSRAYFENLATRRINDPQIHLGIARTYESLNQSDQALQHLSQAYDLAMQDNPERLSLAAKICHYICRVHSFCNNFNDAPLFNRKALELYRQAGEHDNREGIALALIAAGNIHFLKCEHDISLEHYQRALEIYMELYPFDHPDKGVALSSLSLSYYLRGEYECALKHMLECVAVHERLLPTDHPHCAVGHTSVGKLLYKQGKYSEALEQFHYAMGLFDKRRTNHHRNYALLLNNIGKTLYRLNKLDEAYEQYNKAMQFIEKLFLTKSTDHADLAYTWKNFGELRMARFDATGALSLFERARDMYKRLFTIAENHRDIAKCWHLIGQAHVALENDTEAIESFEVALQMWIKTLPKHHPDIALCHQSMGEFYANRKGDIDKAIDHYHTALSIYEMQQDDSSKHIETIRNKLISLKKARHEYI